MADRIGFKAADLQLEKQRLLDEFQDVFDVLATEAPVGTSLHRRQSDAIEIDAAKKAFVRVLQYSRSNGYVNIGTRLTEQVDAITARNADLKEVVATRFSEFVPSVERDQSPWPVMNNDIGTPKKFAEQLHWVYDTLIEYQWSAAGELRPLDPAQIQQAKDAFVDLLALTRENFAVRLRIDRQPMNTLFQVEAIVRSYPDLHLSTNENYPELLPQLRAACLRETTSRMSPWGVIAGLQNSVAILRDGELQHSQDDLDAAKEMFIASIKRITQDGYLSSWLSSPSAGAFNHSIATVCSQLPELGTAVDWINPYVRDHAFEHGLEFQEFRAPAPIPPSTQEPIDNQTAEILTGLITIYAYFSFQKSPALTHRPDRIAEYEKAFIGILQVIEETNVNNFAARNQTGDLIMAVINERPSLGRTAQEACPITMERLFNAQAAAIEAPERPAHQWEHQPTRRPDAGSLF